MAAPHTGRISGCVSGLHFSVKNNIKTSKRTSNGMKQSLLRVLLKSNCPSVQMVFHQLCWFSLLCLSLLTQSISTDNHLDSAMKSRTSEDILRSCRLSTYSPEPYTQSESDYYQYASSPRGRKVSFHHVASCIGLSKYLFPVVLWTKLKAKGVQFIL